MKGIVSHSLLRFKHTNFSCASKISAMISSEIFITGRRAARLPTGNAEHSHFKIHTSSPVSGARARNENCKSHFLTRPDPKAQSPRPQLAAKRLLYQLCAIHATLCQVLTGMCLPMPENIPIGQMTRSWPIKSVSHRGLSLCSLGGLMGEGDGGGRWPRGLPLGLEFRLFW